MNTKILFTGIAFCLIGLILTSIMIGYEFKESQKQKIQLPEEYKAIEKTDKLRGYFTKDSILIIEFDNQN